MLIRLLDNSKKLWLLIMGILLTTSVKSLVL